MEKFFILAHFGGKTYVDGGIALVRESQEAGKKEIIVVGPWSGPGDSGYIVEKWPGNTYVGIVDNGERLELPDSLWDAVMRLEEYEKTDSVKEREEIVSSFENIIGLNLKIRMRLAGAIRFF